MCSKHVEAWNKLIVTQKVCASVCLITVINILRRTVSITSKEERLLRSATAVNKTPFDLDIPENRLLLLYYYYCYYHLCFVCASKWFCSINFCITSLCVDKCSLHASLSFVRHTVHGLMCTLMVISHAVVVNSISTFPPTLSKTAILILFDLMTSSRTWRSLSSECIPYNTFTAAICSGGRPTKKL